MKRIAALAFLAMGSSATYAPAAPSTCAAYTCPKGWSSILDSGFIVCDGPCRPSDCCYQVQPSKPVPPVYNPPSKAAPDSKCVPLRTGNGNKCVIQTGYNTLGEIRLSVGSCADPRIVNFCGCTLKTADNLCVSSSKNTGRNGASLVLRNCGKCVGKAKTWQYLSNGEDYYMRNGFGKYMNFDQHRKTLIQSNDAGYFFLEQPCLARLQGGLPAPRPPAPTPAPARATCATFTCPYGWSKVVDAAFGVCIGRCKVKNCCEKPAAAPAPEPVRSCGAYICPRGWTPKDTVDPGMTMCVVDLVNGCTRDECCVRKYYY